MQTCADARMQGTKQLKDWTGENGVFEGDLVDGVAEGSGVWTGEKGWRYEGKFVKDKFSGHGTYYYPSGRGGGVMYEGEFADGKRNGRGTEYYDRDDGGGVKYEGKFADGKFIG